MTYKQWRNSCKTLAIASLSVIAFFAGYSVRLLLDRNQIGSLSVDELNIIKRTTESNVQNRSTQDFHDVAVGQISPGSIREYLK